MDESKQGTIQFEEEQLEDTCVDSIPERERRLVTQPFDFTVKTLVDQINDGSISVDETWQRKYVWPNSKASRLIESLLLNIPIPVCYFSEEESGKYLVIDGRQRLWSVARFLGNHFPLTGLTTLAHLNRKRFHQLDEKEQRNIKSRALRCIVLTQECHPELKFDVFERLNTGSVSLTQQELRHCMYRGDLNDLLAELSLNKQWLDCLGRETADDRLVDQELILRFLAFRCRLERYRTPFSKFLNEFMRDNRTMSDANKASLKAEFGEAVEKVWLVHRERSFRRFDAETNSWDRNINKALFDLQMLSLSSVSAAEATQRADDIRNGFLELMADGEFKDLLIRATDHRKRVYRRLEMLCDTLLEKGLDLTQLKDKVKPVAESEES